MDSECNGSLITGKALVVCDENHTFYLVYYALKFSLIRTMSIHRVGLLSLRSLSPFLFVGLSVERLDCNPRVNVCG